MSDFILKLKPADPQGSDVLAAERARSQVNVSQLAHHLLHRNGFLDRQKKVLAVLKKNALFLKKRISIYPALTGTMLAWRGQRRFAALFGVRGGTMMII